MKNYKLLFVLLASLSFGFQSCKNDDDTVNQSDIVGVWSVNSLFVDISIDGKSIDEFFETEFEQNFFEEFFTAAFQEQFRDVTIEFKADNTFVSTQDGQETSGKWALNTEGDKMILNQGSADEQEYDIVVATQSQLSLKLGHSEVFPSIEDPNTTSEVKMVFELNLTR